MAVKKTSTTKPRASRSAKPAGKTTATSTPAAEPLLQALPEEVWRDLFGLAKKADRDFGEKLVSALHKIDRGLLPPAATHPFQSEIGRGAGGVDTLLEQIGRAHV